MIIPLLYPPAPYIIIIRQGEKAGMNLILLDRGSRRITYTIKKEDADY